MNLPVSVRLPLRFDAVELLKEAEALPDGAWQSHFNADYHDGGWQGASLRAAGGDAARLYIEPGSSAAVSDTPLMALCPGIATALREFECALPAVRLLRLLPGSVIREHCDYDLRFEDGAARLHLPLTTNPAVEFYVNQQRVLMEPGECWYLNLSLPHRVMNRGESTRLHLVIDCQVNDWLTAQIKAGDLPPRNSSVLSGRERFEHFSQQLYTDSQLQARLAAITDAETFLATVLEVAAQRGHALDREELLAVMRRSRRGVEIGEGA